MLLQRRIDAKYEVTLSFFVLFVFVIYPIFKTFIATFNKKNNNFSFKNKQKVNFCCLTKAVKTYHQNNY
ncbi:hypothetical Protein psc1_01860 [Candidatus Phytoplasma solani]